MFYNANNNKRMNKEEKVLEIVRSSKVGNISCEEAAIQICLLFSVVGQSEQLVCPNCNSLDITDRIFKKECLRCGQKFKAN